MPSTASPTSSLYPLAILDCGASSLRLTLQPSPSSHALPTIHVAPNAIVRTRPPSRKILVGTDIEAKCTDFSGLTLRLPFEKGLLTDWAAQKAIWDAEIGKALGKLPAKDIATSSIGKLLEGWNLIITEAYFNLPELEVGLETMWFEEYGVRGIWRTTAAQLASFAPLHTSYQKSASSAIDTEASSPLRAEEESAPHNTPVEAQASSPRNTFAASPSAKDGITPSSKRQKRQAVSTQTYSETKNKNKSAAAGSRLASHRRPEACVVIDLGHSYTHVVPIVQGEVAWMGVKRLDIGGKLMTNLLKEMISFKQWDMMEESWLISHLKEKAFFVTASDLEEERTGPSSWNRKVLLKLAKRRIGQNPIEQEFVLPDYSDAKVSRSVDSRYGRIRKGPGKWEVNDKKKARVGLASPLAASSSSKVEDEGNLLQEEREADAFIADPVLAQVMPTLLPHNLGRGVQGREEKDDDEDEDEDAGEDYRESGSESDGDAPIKESFQTHQKQQQTTQQSKRKARGADDGEEEQVLVLSNERWQIPELLFNPQQIGLDALPLPELIVSSISASSSDDALRGLMFANIILVGGLANITNLRRRLEVDLRSLAPSDLSVRVRVPTSPATAAVSGGLHLPKGFVTGKLIGKEEWEKPGQGTALARERFLGWGSQAAAYLSKML